MNTAPVIPIGAAYPALDPGRLLRRHWLFSMNLGALVLLRVAIYRLPFWVDGECRTRNPRTVVYVNALGHCRGFQVVHS